MIRFGTPLGHRFSIPALVLALCGVLMPPAVAPAAAADPVVPTLTVDTVADDAAATACSDAVLADCSLRGALINANFDGNAEMETIIVPAGIYQLTLPGDGTANGSLDVRSSVELVGAGAGTTIIDAMGLDRVVTVNGGGVTTDRVFVASGLTFRGGRPCNQLGGTDDGGNKSGGGLMVHGIGRLTDVIVEDNVTCGAGGGIWSPAFGASLTLERVIIRGNTGHGAGGIQSDASLTMTDSTVSGNVSNLAPGGGLRLRGVAVIDGSTISGNHSRGRGGGIDSGDDTSAFCCYVTATITNSTISGNVAHAWTSGTPQRFPGIGGGIHLERSSFTLRHVTITQNVAETHPDTGGRGSGGGIATTPLRDGFLSIENSIVAGNVAIQDCLLQSGLTYTARGLLGCAGEIDPKLGALADNGGLTLTHAPSAASLAIDLADSGVCAPEDQRGAPRPSGFGCDIGAVEVQVAPPPPDPTASPEPTASPTEPPLPTAEPTPVPTSAPSEPPLPTPEPSASPSGPPGSGPAISIDDAEAVEGNAGTSSMAFTVRLSMPSSTSVFVTASTVDGTASSPSDYLAGTTELAFAPGETAATFQVQVAGDAIRELPETFSVQLTGPFGGTLGRATATGTIREPDFGPFDADAISSAPANAYLLGMLSHYAYEDNAIGGTRETDFEDAFRARFDHPTEGLEVIGFFENPITQVQGAFIETDEALIVVVRGTEMPSSEDPADAVDFIVDGAATQTGGVHSGFAAAAASVYGPVSERAIAARAAGKRVWLTGHSLGGAVANVLGLLLQSSGVEVQGIHTYGAPRAFSATTALAYDALFASRPTIRWVDDLDPVTHVPPREILDYVHVGQTYNIVPTGPGGTGCVILADSAERLVGGDLDDHSSTRYLSRIYANLPTDALRNAVADPPMAPSAPFVMDGCDEIPATPLSFARDAFLAGRDVLATAKSLAYDYGLTSAEALAEKLMAAGYAAKDVARALKAVLRASAQAVFDTLSSLKVEAKEIAAALWEAFRTSAGDIAGMLRDAGYSAIEAAIAFRDGLGLGIDAVAEALHTAGYQAVEKVEALQAAFAAGALRISQALKAAGVDATSVARGLAAVFGLGSTAIASTLRLAGYTAGEVGTMLTALYGFGAEQVAAGLKAAGYLATDIAAHLRNAFELGSTLVALYLKNIGFSATAVAEALVDVFDLGPQAVARKLDQVKFTATEVMSALRTALGLGANAAADAMEQAGFGATAVLGALRDVFGHTAATGAAALAYAGYSATQLFTAMKTVFGTGAAAATQIVKDLGYAAIDVASALKSVFARTAAQATNLLFAAGYLALDVAGALKSVYAATASQVTTWLKNAGYSVIDIAAALKSKFSRTAAQTIELLKEAGYGVIAVASAIKAAFGRSAAQMVTLLAAAGYGVTAIANALRSAYDKSVEEVASLLWSAGYAIDQIISALRSAFNMSLAAVLDVLRSIGII